MSLKSYDVVINGYQTTLRLSDADAKREGLFREPAKVEKKDEPATPPPAKKAVAKRAPTKKAAPRNKARKTAANKAS